MKTPFCKSGHICSTPHDMYLYSVFGDMGSFLAQKLNHFRSGFREEAKGTVAPPPFSSTWPINP